LSAGVILKKPASITDGVTTQFQGKNCLTNTWDLKFIEYLSDKMKRPDIIIGIDPDVESSGIAALNCNTRSVKIGRKKFPELIESLKDLSDSCKEKGIPLLVVVEASWLISHNWHAGTIKGTRAIAKTGYNVGKNHQVGILIVEYCKSIGLDIKEHMPLKKVWKSRDGKISHDEISYFIPGLPKRTNAEERDAALLAWNEANFPIKIKT